jgi:hypothetical protein
MRVNWIGKPERASVLLLVLGTIFVLSLLVTSFLDHVEEEVLYRDQRQTPVDLELEWRSYRDATWAILCEIKKWDGDLFSPEQGWGDPLRYAHFLKRKDLKVHIDIQDETGKIPCEKTYQSLQQLWIAHSVKNWSAERKIQEAWQLVLDGKPVALKKNPGEFGTEKESVSLKNLDTLRSLDAFSSIFFHEKGWGNEAWTAFRASLSSIAVGPININTASESLRQQIAQKHSWDPQALEAFFHQKDTFHMGNIERFFRNDSSLRKYGFPPKANTFPSIGTQCKVLNVNIALSRGEQSLRKSFWLDVSGTP